MMIERAREFELRKIVKLSELKGLSASSELLTLD